MKRMENGKLRMDNWSDCRMAVWCHGRAVVVVWGVIGVVVNGGKIEFRIDNG